MQLVPVYAEDLAGSNPLTAVSSAGRIHIDSTARQLYGIQLATVERTSGSRTLRVTARVAPDETRIYRVNIGTDGYVKNTQGDAVGNRVAKNQRLATIYSPEFLTLIGGYLSANERTQGSNNRDAPTQQFAAGVQARADRLRNLGMSDAQIEELGNSRSIPEDVYVVSPVDGFILSRSISSGQRFERFAEFYRIADLSHVWILADVFGSDIQAFRPGTVTKVILPDSGKILHARVADVLPEVNPMTRTMRVRLEAENPGFVLRPEMFVNVELPVPASGSLTVPVDAVLDSGLEKRVFVDAGDGYLEEREVNIGWRADDRAQVLSGLQEGEKVVASGTFLVDSETRLHMSRRSAAADGAATGPGQIAQKIN
jgi:RND family efflux transporter MFP subunit